MVRNQEKTPIQVAYERRNPDLDPQLIWRGKDLLDESPLVVNAPPLYIQEKIHPKVLIDDLKRRSKEGSSSQSGFVEQIGLFDTIKGDVGEGAKTEFYQHDQNWTNRMILGDSLQVMASLAEREGLRGKVQCIYFDPPYGIKFNSNFQWSTTDRDVQDGKSNHITREPEQVKAFRDTWKEGVHSYLQYARDRIAIARDLLADTGSIFVQIGDENVHRIRALLDEVFGEQNFISLVTVQTTTGFEANYLGNMSDFVIWYAKDKSRGKSRPPFYKKSFVLGEGNARWLMLPDYAYRGVTAKEKRGEVSTPTGSLPYKPDNIISQGRSSEPQPFSFKGKTYDSWYKNSHWKANYPTGMERLAKANRIHVAENSIQYIRYHTDFDVAIHGNMWSDTGSGNFTDDKIYVVQTNAKVIERCILMATDPGDLVLDPTCGSGTTAAVAEQWGRRWTPAFRKDDTPLNRKPGGLMEQSNASLQRGDQG
jgi:adenine-specific DNA-methyltransferase